MRLALASSCHTVRAPTRVIRSREVVLPRHLWVRHLGHWHWPRCRLLSRQLQQRRVVIMFLGVEEPGDDVPRACERCVPVVLLLASPLSS
eukprot:5565773-Lingulodinium_polyedra.AAC.1